MNKERAEMIYGGDGTVSVEAFAYCCMTYILMGASNPTTAIANILPHPSSDRADELWRPLSSRGWWSIKNDCPPVFHMVVRCCRVS